MAYERKTWKNRQSEYPNRRTLTPVDGQENTYDVARAEGLVMEEGDAFDQQAMNDLEERIESGLVDSGVNVYTHTKSGTVHEFTGQGANGRAMMTADVAAGDTFTVNGTPVTAYMGAESAVDMMAGSTYSGRWVTFVCDSEANTLNFKGGGGKVTVSGLSADVVKTGATVTVKQGAKVIQSFTGAYLVSSEQVAANVQEISSGAFDVSTEWTALYDCKILFLAFHTTPISGFSSYEITCSVNGDTLTSKNLIANVGNGTGYIGLVDVKEGDVVKLRYRAPTSQKTFAHVQLYAIR